MLGRQVRRCPNIVKAVFTRSADSGKRRVLLWARALANIDPFLPVNTGCYAAQKHCRAL